MKTLPDMKTKRSQSSGQQRRTMLEYQLDARQVRHHQIAKDDIEVAPRFEHAQGFFAAAGDDEIDADEMALEGVGE